VAQVFHLKGRVFSNPMHVAVSNIEAAEKDAYLSGAAAIWPPSTSPAR
jgi:tRNA A37 threonylcarbamoyladenosine synthetase subunit TsaC/SUA5/YrdC